MCNFTIVRCRCFDWSFTSGLLPSAESTLEVGLIGAGFSRPMEDIVHSQDSHEADCAHGAKGSAASHATGGIVGGRRRGRGSSACGRSVVGGLAGGRGSRQPVRSRNRHKVVVKEEVPEEGEDENQQENTVDTDPQLQPRCYICDDVFDEDNPATPQGRIFYHGYCLSAERSLKGVASATPDGNKTLSELRTKQPLVYKAKVRALVVQRRRTREDLAKVKEAVDLLVTYKSYKRVKGRLLLPENPFKAWYKFWEGLTQSEADAKWDADSTSDHIYREKEDGKVVVAVQQHPVLAEEEGVATKARHPHSGQDRLWCRRGASSEAHALDGRRRR